MKRENIQLSSYDDIFGGNDSEVSGTPNGDVVVQIGPRAAADVAILDDEAVPDGE